jgi:competence protein ComEA
MNKYIAVVSVLVVIDGERTTIEPGQPLPELSAKDVEALRGMGSIERAPAQPETAAPSGAATLAGEGIPGTNTRESEAAAPDNPASGDAPDAGEAQLEQTSTPGEPLPELPDSAYAPDAAPLDAPDAVPPDAPVLYDINTDSVLDLVAAGLSEKLALAVAAYRTQHGPFASVDDLVKVNGIGPATLAELRYRLTV